MQLQVSLPKKIIITAAIMLALILFVFYFQIPNPNMILIAGLVLCSALFGFGGGIVAAAIMLGYTLFFFSTDYSFTQFTPENMQKVWVSLIGIAADMILVCLLKQTEVREFRKVDALTQELHSENEKLQRISLIDALTGNRNRMALRQDYDSYQDHEVTVMMLDLNDFKRINDTRGHEEGDRILRETGRMLADTFGEEHCYRYGGDEFLVIVPDISETGFREKLDSMNQRRPVIEGSSTADYSIGHARAMLNRPDTLRTLISDADKRMYEAKRAKAGTPAFANELLQPEVMDSEYTPDEMKSFLEEMSGKYDLARVVDPVECRILEFQDDGKFSMNESCYCIWNSEQKCINCSSATACRTGCHQEKTEYFQDNVYYIQSNPVSLRLANGSAYNAVLELVNVEKGDAQAANDREAENIGARAANYMAHHDRLTNLLNADAFYELSRDMIRNEPDKAWVMITGNIMNFHLINSLFSEMKGNEALVRTAVMLKDISEDSGGLSGRLGGDQFAILIPRAAYREEVLTDAAQELAGVFGSGIFTFLIHFGVYGVDDPSIPVSVMCDRANSALHTIRDDLTRTVAYFNEEVLRKTLEKQKVIGSFDEALKDGQFQMYLQPLVKKDGSLIGAEALARWHKPDGTVVTPADFVETLEKAGLIHKLDLYIWELAVKQLRDWQGTDKAHLFISVNMSAKDLFCIDVFDALTDLVDKYGVDSSLLRLEITETALLVEPEKSNAVVSELRARGFLVEIDDFGKGYSSLSLLKNISADVLKTDMCFLHEIEDRERSRIILQTIIAMADSLGMMVIAEGVETEQQLDTLSSMGCKYFQGFYFSRPIPACNLETKLN